MKYAVFLVPILALSLEAAAPWRMGTQLPPLLDLKGVEAAHLIPGDPRDPAKVEAVRQAWASRVAGVKDHAALRLRLPSGPQRQPLLLAASQALRAQNPDQRLYLAYDPEAGQLWDETAWGAVDGGALGPEDLGPEPEHWRDVLAAAQESFPGRPWTLWLGSDPGARLALLMGDGGRLVVPPGGPAEKLLERVPEGFSEVEGGLGDLTLRNPATGKALRWRFEAGLWQAAALPSDRHEVAVTDREAYDVGALLARMRGTQLRDRAALRNIESRLDVDLHLQGDQGSGMDLGFTFRAFEQAGETEEMLQLEVRVNGVRANLRGEMQLPIVESRASLAAPVALGLTERFRYRDGGPLGEGRRRILFEPVDPDPQLWAGELWVDEGNGRVIEERSSRSGLPGIVKSETRRLIHGEPAPGLWRVLRMEAFERWVTAGGVAQVQRRLAYSDLRVNAPDFEARRAGARGSESTMLKQTVDGVRYFTRQKDGSRRIESRLKASGRGLGLVVIAEPGLDPPIFPAGGLAYFDFNAFDRGIQVNALTAGVFNTASVFVPNLVAGFDLGLGGNAMLWPVTERPVREGELLERDAVDRAWGGFRAILGRDLSLGFRLEATGSLQYNRFRETREDDYRTEGFVLPPSGWTRVLSGRLSWQHRGFQLSGSYGRGRRPTGTYGTAADPQAIPDEGRYSVWGASLGYDHRFRTHGWIHGEVGQFAGKGFDRFLSLESGGFGGIRVAGIRSNSVTSDRISYAKLGLVLPPTAGLRASVSLEHARARSLGERRTYRLTGLGISGDLPGFGWFTTLRVDLGIGLQSDIPGVRTVSGYVALLRVF